MQYSTVKQGNKGYNTMQTYYIHHVAGFDWMAIHHAHNYIKQDCQQISYKINMIKTQQGLIKQLKAATV